MRTIVHAAMMGALCLALVERAAAAPTAKQIDTCRSTIYKSVFVYTKVRAGVLQKCNDARIKAGDYSGLGAGVLPCSPTKIVKAEAKLRSKINGRCQSLDVTPALLAWPPACPTFEAACNPGFPTDSTSDQIVDCLLCVIDTGVDRSIDFLYASLASQASGSAAQKCQRSLGKTVEKFAFAKHKILSKCRQLKDRGRLVPPSAECLAGDASGLAKLAKAETSKIAKLHAKCDPTNPSQVGLTNCRQVVVPGGPPCAGSITTIAGLAACVDCVAEYHVDCIDRATAPHHAPYPPQCQATPGPTSTYPRPTPTFDPIQFFIENHIVRAGKLPFPAYGLPRPSPTPTP